VIAKRAAKVAEANRRKGILVRIVSEASRTDFRLHCRNMSDPNRFKVAHLKEQLQKRQLPATGNKSELIVRLQRADFEGHWMRELENRVENVAASVEIEAGEGASSTLPQVNVSGNRDETSDETLRELEWLRREQRLLERELQVAERENRLLRNAASDRENRPEVQSKISVKAVSDLLSEFNGSEGLYQNWEKQLRLLMRTYQLDSNNAKVLLGMRLKGKAAEWFHSCPEHIELSIEEILTEMKKMFDCRQSRLKRRRRFEKRCWKTGENSARTTMKKLFWQTEFPLTERR